MANPAPVTYEIRLRDQMTKAVKKMGLSVKQLQTRLRKGLAGALKAARKAMRGFTIAAAAGAAAVGAVGFAAVRMGRDFLEAASKLEDTQAKFRVVFQGIEDDATKMAQEMAVQLGYGEGSIMGLMSTLQDTLVPMGFARDEAMAFSGSLTSLAADLASFNPGIRDAEDAVGALQSVLVGMNRSALRFGVVINEDKIASEAMALGLGELGRELTDQEKVLARVSLLLKGTADAHGDAMRTADSYKNSTRALSEAITDIREEMGQRLKVALTETIKGMGGVDAIINMVRLAFEFFTKVLIDILIPTVANVMVNFSKFIQAMGGVDKAVVSVGDGVLLMGKAFRLMWNVVSLILKLFVGGIETIVFVINVLIKNSQLTISIIGLAFVSAFRLAIETLALFGKGIDAVVIFIKDTAIKIFQNLINTIADLVLALGKSLKALGEYKLVPGFVKSAGEAAVKAAEGMREFSASTEDLKGGSTIFKKLGDDLDAFGDKIQPTQAALLTYINKTYQGLKDVSTEFADEVMEDLPAMNALIASLGEGASSIGGDYDALADKVKAALAEMESIEIVAPEQRDRVADLTAHLERMLAPLEAVAGAEDAAAGAADRLGQSVDDAAEGIQNFTNNALPAMEQTLLDIKEGAAQSFARGMTDALMSIADGSKSAGEAFRAFAAGFLADVARMIIQTLILKAVRNAMGIPLANGGIVAGGLGEMTAFANGGVASGGLGRFVPVKGYATGGPIVNKPHVALIGEGQHNEAVVPLPDGRSIPVDMTGAPETQVAINIEAVDGASVDRMLFDRQDTLRSIISTAIAESRSFRGAVARA